VKPLIGVSASFRDFGDYLGEGYQRPISMAGGLPVTLPRLTETVDELLDRIDGLMIAAGHDIDPVHYGQEPHVLLGRLDAARDRFELDLVQRALHRGLPVLGACRGMQVLNVALGGTMLQDLSLEPRWQGHPSDPTGRYWGRFQAAVMDGDPVPEHPRHPIDVRAGSRLEALLGAQPADVDSFHHQAVDRIGDGLIVSARAPDGVVEALELPGSFVLAMQCELHEGWRWDRRWLGVFEAFVAAAAERRGHVAA
jgi:putative glutamine amidotransferase